MIDQGTLENIRSALDIVQVVGEVVKLEKRGHNYFGCCPFHQEKTPSFSVNSEKQLFHCFGCKAGGDIIKFVQLYFRYDFQQSVEELAGRAGIEIKSNNRNANWDEALEIMQFVQELYQSTLDSSGEAAKKYLADRKVPVSVWQNFGVGLHPGDHQFVSNSLKSKNLSRDIAVQLGILGRTDRGEFRDRFRGRLMIPICDERGRIRGFGARGLSNEEPKYINSPASFLFDKKKLLYGMHLATAAIRKKNYAVLVEGYFDVMALHEFGVSNAIGSMGTALTLDQIRKLKRLSGRVISLYDADSAGVAATERNLESFLTEGVEVKVALTPASKDIDGMLHDEGSDRAHKLESLRKMFASAEPALDYLVRQKILSESDSVKRAKRTSELMKILDRIPDEVERGMLKRELVRRFELPIRIDTKQGLKVPQARSRFRGREGARDWAKEALEFLVIWGAHSSFSLTELIPYLSFSTKWSKLLRDLISQGMDSGQLAQVAWLSEIDDATQAEIREWIIKEQSPLGIEQLNGLWFGLVGRLRETYFKLESQRLQLELEEAEKNHQSDEVRKILIQKQDLVKMMRAVEPS